MSTEDKQNMTRSPDARDPLNGVQPIGKSRRFRVLLPLVISKIEGGVEHAEIIRALAEHGLELTQGTYFSYLNRYRSGALRKVQKKGPAAPPRELLEPPASQPASTAAAGTSRRPKTFDYDPRGIHPDLLK